MDYLNVLLRTVFFYVFITIVYRFMGKREVGELSIVDLIVSILIAELAAISIENYKASIFFSLLSISAVVIIQILVSKISLKSSTLRNMVDGKPSLIINKGKVNFKEMIKQRYNLEDLMTQLRAREVRSLDEVDYAILETSGKLSVFLKQKGKTGTFPLPLILDGTIQEDTLKFLHKSKSWLLENLEREHISLEDVFYAFYKETRIFIIKNKDCIH